MVIIVYMLSLFMYTTSASQNTAAIEQANVSLLIVTSDYHLR